MTMIDNDDKMYPRKNNFCIKDNNFELTCMYSVLRLFEVKQCMREAWVT